MNDLVTWLRAQLDEDEQWALAASRPYEYADEGSKTPAAGVHWQWVTGENWEPVTPDPVLNEFVAEPGHSCNLVTVEEWPVTTRITADRSMTRMRRRPLANSIVEVDSATAGHIALHDPARVLAEVAAKRRILDLHQRVDRRPGWVGGYEEPACYGCHADFQEEYYEPDANNCEVARLLALPYAGEPGYQAEWRT